MNRLLVTFILFSCGFISPASADILVTFSGSGPGGDASLTLEHPVEFEMTGTISNRQIVFVVAGAATGTNDRLTPPD